MNEPSEATVCSSSRRCRHDGEVEVNWAGDRINCFCVDCKRGWHGLSRPVVMLSGRVRKPPQWVQRIIDATKQTTYWQVCCATEGGGPIFEIRDDADEWLEAELSQYDDDAYQINEVKMTREKFESLAEFAGW